MLVLAGPQGDLLVVDETAHRMLETALATLAFEHIVLLPEMGEICAAGAQFVNQAQQCWLFQAGATVGTEFRCDAAGADLPIHQKISRRRVQKDKAQHVGGNGFRFPWLVQPAGKEFCRLGVPAQNVPVASHQIGRHGDVGQQLQEDRWRLIVIRQAGLGVAPAGNFEQIGAFAAGEA